MAILPHEMSDVKYYNEDIYCVYHFVWASVQVLDDLGVRTSEFNGISKGCKIIYCEMHLQTVPEKTLFVV